MVLGASRVLGPTRAIEAALITVMAAVKTSRYWCRTGFTVRTTLITVRKDASSQNPGLLCRHRYCSHIITIAPTPVYVRRKPAKTTSALGLEAGVDQIWAIETEHTGLSALGAIRSTLQSLTPQLAGGLVVIGVDIWVGSLVKVNGGPSYRPPRLLESLLTGRHETDWTKTLSIRPYLVAQNWVLVRL